MTVPTAIVTSHRAIGSTRKTGGFLGTATHAPSCSQQAKALGKPRALFELNVYTAALRKAMPSIRNGSIESVVVRESDSTESDAIRKKCLGRKRFFKGDLSIRNDPAENSLTGSDSSLCAHPNRSMSLRQTHAIRPVANRESASRRPYLQGH